MSSACRFYSFENRKSLVNFRDFSSLEDYDISNNLLDLIPKILKGNELREIIYRIKQAREKEKPIIWALGAHVIKCGLSPLIIDLMTRGMATAIAMTGAGAIHDFEIALWGKTSEDVEESLKDGSFGMTSEPAARMNFVISSRVTNARGIGEALQQELVSRPTQYSGFSLLYHSGFFKAPATIHVALGADVIHAHPSADGAKIGQGSLNDFRLFTELVSQLQNGGVFLNIGSAVFLPEVFLKALSLARNQGYELDNFTTVNLDMIQHYRPNTNVVIRPHIGGKGKGYSLTGHHEIMLPLLYHLLIEGNKNAD